MMPPANGRFEQEPGYCEDRTGGAVTHHATFHATVPTVPCMAAHKERNFSQISFKKANESKLAEKGLLVSNADVTTLNSAMVLCRCLLLSGTFPCPVCATTVRDSLNSYPVKVIALMHSMSCVNSHIIKIDGRYA
jgi:hypothetical protein